MVKKSIISKMVKPSTIKHKDMFDRRITVCFLCKGTGLNPYNPLLRCQLCGGTRVI